MTNGQYGVAHDGYDDEMFDTVIQALDYIYDQRLPGCNVESSVYFQIEGGLAVPIYSQSQVQDYVDSREDEQTEEQKLSYDYCQAYNFSHDSTI